MSSKKQYLGTKAVGITRKSIGKGLLAAVGGLAMILLTGVVHAAATIQDIEFSARPGSKFEIRMDFDQPPPDVKSYTIEKPMKRVGRTTCQHWPLQHNTPFHALLTTRPTKTSIFQLGLASLTESRVCKK